MKIRQNARGSERGWERDLFGRHIREGLAVAATGDQNWMARRCEKNWEDSISSSRNSDGGGREAGPRAVLRTPGACPTRLGHGKEEAGREVGSGQSSI